MGLIRKLLGGAGDAHSAASSQFRESEPAAEAAKSRNGPRRELVQVVLRETMRKHGIPSDWIDCRVLSVLTRQHKSGVHVQFLVRKGDDQLLRYVHAFQESFRQGIDRFDPQAAQWLFSVGWQFEAPAKAGLGRMTNAAMWGHAAETRPADAGDTLPPEAEEDLASDLQALQAAMSRPAALGDLPEAPSRQHRKPDER